MHIPPFLQKDGFFTGEEMTESICQTVANSAPHGMGIKDEQNLATMSGKDAYATVLAIWLFSPSCCAAVIPKRGNSALSSIFGIVFLFLSWTFIHAYLIGGHILQKAWLLPSCFCKSLFKKPWQYSFLFPNRNIILITSAPPLLAGIGRFQTSGTNFLNQMVFIARTSSTPTPNFMLVMFALDSPSQGLHVAADFALHPLASMALILRVQMTPNLVLGRHLFPGD